MNNLNQQCSYVGQFSTGRKKVMKQCAATKSSTAIHCGMRMITSWNIIFHLL